MFDLVPTRVLIRLAAVFTVLLTMIFSIHLMAQTAVPAPAPEKALKESSGIARTEKDVPVPQPKPDQAIADRLTKIFTLTGWFQDLKVTSQEGIVTLNGKVDVASQREWAVDLANDADGVVAVINKVTLTEIGWFDLTSTKNELKTLWKKFFAFIPHLFIGLVILIISVLLYRFFAKINREFWVGRIQNSVLSDVVSKLGALPILLVGLYLFLQVLGLTGLAFTLLGGTGALGLVAGFAFKNILENYFSGVMLSIRKPFGIGDIIEVAGEKGVVFKMTTRGTTLVDADGKHILIPNTIIFTGILRNQSAGGVARIKMSFEAKPEHLQKQKQELLAFLKERGEIVKSPEIDIYAGGTAEKPTLEASFWVDPKVTSVDKLKSLIGSEQRFKSTDSEILGTSKPKDTESEVQAILARAATVAPHDPKDKNL